LRLLKLFVFLVFTVNSPYAFSNEFNALLYSGKWANAKLWLLKHRNELNSREYFISHLQVGYFLNEHELCRAYCDSLKQVQDFEQSLSAQVTYHILYSKYFQYHLKPEKALDHAKRSLAFAGMINNPFTYCMSYTQLANALRRSVDDAGVRQRNFYAEKAYALALLMPDSSYLYKAKVIQTLTLIPIDLLSKDNREGKIRKEIMQKLEASNAVILRHHSAHPQLVHNYLLMGLANVGEFPDEGIKYYQKAQQMLNEINDGNSGVLIYLVASLNHLMDAAYEVKYKQTLDEDYLNTAIVWAKQNIDLDEHKQRYEGFYLYRRYIDHYNPPAEQRIAKLYLTLHQLTGNENYLNFATKYIEYFRHKPITQVGKQQNLFGILNSMALTENGNKTSYQVKTDHTTNMITDPERVSRFLNANQAIISFFSYEAQSTDSIVFLVQCIERERLHTVVLTYAKNAVQPLSESIYTAVEMNRPLEYKQQANKAFRLLLEPALKKLGKKITHLNIIQPAYFSTPLQFEGFLTDTSGTGFSSFNYVFDKYNVSYITSFTHFVSHKQKEIAVKRVNVWNPDYASTPLAELSETKQVNETIANLFPMQTIVCSTKKNLLSQLLQGQILQVSAHASASFDDLERPKIYTAMQPDSVLLDIDLEPLSTNTQLVIYAACKSNVGNVQHNGIIDGFTRATLSAGAGGTICSLYNVEEGVTCEMLRSFYRHLAKGCNSADALYLAKKELKQKYPNPKIWQAYIYTGAEQTFKSTATGISFYLFIGLTVAFAAMSYCLLKTDFN
ncbi:MAG: CHAT domain-containing protein, partial [Bacteroidota bacterium]